ncbi:hypothetical protein LXT21_30850 [Myxococcus sp. K38C18041901]|uniref:hypothetical protein n=1 Tax=Myxococcus guangdongensis TaxID=2906760 RepID=UPI0020A82D07|nr:hypothetical protein [Myxococcus guangdongensis]MCP3063184.1 hypothetical protein [Myxococcus guangdongensis]
MLCAYCNTELTSQEDKKKCPGCGMAASADVAASNLMMRTTFKGMAPDSDIATQATCEHGQPPDGCAMCVQPKRCGHNQVAGSCVSCRQAENASRIKGGAAAAPAMKAKAASTKKARRDAKKAGAKTVGQPAASVSGGVSAAAASDGASAAAAAGAGQMAKKPPAQDTDDDSAWVDPEEELMKFVSSKLSDKEQIVFGEMLARWKGVLGPLHEVGLAVVRAKWDSTYVNQVREHLKKWELDDGKVRLGTGAANHGDWALKVLREDAQKFAADPEHQYLFPTKRGSLHHKISQATLRELSQKLEKAGAQGAVLRVLLDKIQSRVRPTATKSDYLEILLNLPANLEVGPLSELRKVDPGAGFDPNHDNHGKVRVQTPRSKHLAVVEQLARSNDIDWQRLSAFLKTADEEHQKMLKGTGRLLTPPVRDRWPKVGDKYSRR